MTPLAIPFRCGSGNCSTCRIRPQSRTSPWGWSTA
ncbi:hypothetical protein [Pseudomonas sp. 21C1]